MRNSKKITLAALLGAAAISASLISPAQAALPTITPGVLTVGTDDPAYGPWFDSNTPSNGKGYEAAVAYAVAKELGYSADTVSYTHLTLPTICSV